MRGIPVDSGGNYTDSSGQEWICDTLEHVYGETAQVIKRIKSTSVKYTVEDHGGEAVMIHTKSGKRYFTYGEYGRYNKNASTTLKYTLYNCIYRVTCNADTEEILSEETLNGGALSFYTTYTEQVVGDWCYSSTTDLVEWAIPLRQLENGDPLPSEYISVTGELSSGAQIIYPSEAKALTLTTKETESLSALSGYESSTTIYNNNTAEMKVKLLRKDFEMQYIHWIKESQSFICEKSGKYKIICVGGGSSGGIGAAGAADVLQAAGTTTSFGNIISANGGGRSKTSASENFKAESTVGGQSGYDGINYGSSSHVLRAEVNSCLSSSGGESTVMWGTGHGYGAGGGAKGTSLTYTAGTSTSIELIACGGQCGKIESTIVDLEENQTVFCTVGGGGVLNLSDENVLEYIVNYVHTGADECSKTGAELSACVTDGADGVIIVQYLGI